MSKQNLNIYLNKFEDLLPRFHRSLNEMNEDCVAHMDLTPHQLIVLKIIADSGDSTMTELSAKMNVTMGNTTGLVDRLTKEGYVSRSHDPNDRRIVKVKLTGKGRQVMTRAKKKRQSMFLKVLERLTTKDIETMLELFEKIIGERADQQQ